MSLFLCRIRLRLGGDQRGSRFGGHLDVTGAFVKNSQSQENLCGCRTERTCFLEMLDGGLVVTHCLRSVGHIHVSFKLADRPQETLISVVEVRALRLDQAEVVPVALYLRRGLHGALQILRSFVVVAVLEVEETEIVQI